MPFNQSTMMYPDYETWLLEYSENTVKLCSKFFKKGGKNVLYIIWLWFRRKKSFIDLVNDMNLLQKGILLKKKYYKCIIKMFILQNIEKQVRK